MSANTKTANNWTFDTRVRERNLKSGLLTEKDLEKHLASLPDLEGQSESFGIHQPALEAPELPDDEDDEEDDIADESSPDATGGAPEENA